MSPRRGADTGRIVPGIRQLRRARHREGAGVRTKVRKFDDGSVHEKTFRAGEKFRPVHTQARKMQYLYDSGDAAVFMDTRDYEQLELPRELAAEAMRWMRPNDEVDVLF